MTEELKTWKSDYNIALSGRVAILCVVSHGVPDSRFHPSNDTPFQYYIIKCDIYWNIDSKVFKRDVKLIHVHVISYVLVILPLVKLLQSC